jgi:hypothetical protein
VEFWKSTRKILAASKSSYEKLCGKSAIDLTSDEISEPLTKRICTSDEDRLQDILLGVKKLEKGLDFFKSMAKSLECLICKGVCKKPLVSINCCQHVIGCELCVLRWVNTHGSSCPHCSTTGLQHISLKGFDSMLAIASSIFDQSPALESSDHAGNYQEPYAGSDSSEELPPVNFI